VRETGREGRSRLEVSEQDRKRVQVARTRLGPRQFLRPRATSATHGRLIRRGRAKGYLRTGYLTEAHTSDTPGSRPRPCCIAIRTRAQRRFNEIRRGTK